MHLPNEGLLVGQCKSPRALTGLALACTLFICIHVQPIRAHLGCVWQVKLPSLSYHIAPLRWKRRKMPESDSWLTHCSVEPGLLCLRFREKIVFKTGLLKALHSWGYCLRQWACSGSQCSSLRELTHRHKQVGRFLTHHPRLDSLAADENMPQLSPASGSLETTGPPLLLLRSQPAFCRLALWPAPLLRLALQSPQRDFQL